MLNAEHPLPHSEDFSIFSFERFESDRVKEKWSEIERAIEGKRKRECGREVKSGCLCKKKVANTSKKRIMDGKESEQNNGNVIQFNALLAV